MPLKPGQPVLGEDTTETRDAAGGTIDAGTPAMIDANGEMVPVDTDAGDLAGVARHTDDNGGRGNALGIDGVFVVAVDSGVSDGDALAGGNATNSTTGVLVSDSSGDALAHTDAGGTWHDDEQGPIDVPDGYAVVSL